MCQSRILGLHILALSAGRNEAHVERLLADEEIRIRSLGLGLHAVVLQLAIRIFLLLLGDQVAQGVKVVFVDDLPTW